jgi:hypothetical protein
LSPFGYWIYKLNLWELESRIKQCFFKKFNFPLKINVLINNIFKRSCIFYFLSVFKTDVWKTENTLVCKNPLTEDPFFLFPCHVKDQHERDHCRVGLTRFYYFPNNKVKLICNGNKLSLISKSTCFLRKLSLITTLLTEIKSFLISHWVIFVI